MSLRIGIIGSGFAEKHIEAIDQINDAEVVAICSRNEAKARSISRGSFYHFENYLDMLKKENLDAVYICLPPHLHGDLEKACSEYVKGLIIEKPVTTSLKQGLEINEYFKKAGTIVSVGYMNRYRNNLLKAKAHFAEDPAVLINSAWCGELPPPYWWRRREMSGGQLSEQCTHFLDAIRYISGEFEEVSAFANNGFIDDVEDFNVDDSMVMNFRLKNGAIGNAMTGCFSHPHGGGELGLFTNFASRDTTYRFTEHQMDLQVQYAAGHTETMLSKENAVLLENKAFLQALRSGNTSSILSSYEDSLETLKVSFAADLSIQEKRTVKISEL